MLFGDAWNKRMDGKVVNSGSDSNTSSAAYLYTFHPLEVDVYLPKLNSRKQHQQMRVGNWMIGGEREIDKHLLDAETCLHARGIHSLLLLSLPFHLPLIYA